MNAANGTSSIPSQRRLAVAVGRSPAAVCAWVKRDDWPFARVGPWPLSDVPKMKAWAGDSLQENRNAEAPHTSSPDSFWLMFERMEAVPVKHDGAEDDVAAALAQPPEFCTPYERAILSGNRKPTQAEVRALVALTVKVRSMVAADAEWLGRWLTGRPEAEVTARLRAAIYEPLAWYAQQVGNKRNDVTGLGTFSYTPEVTGPEHP